MEFVLESIGNVGEREEQETKGEEAVIQGEGAETPEISLHAISGFPSPRTMRLLGKVNGHSMVILVDIGSTHNFFYPNIISKTPLTLNSREQIVVSIANGERSKSEGRLENFQVVV